MKVLGFQFASSTGQHKHNTVVVTDTGHLLKHRGTRTLRTSPTRGFNLAPGNLDLTILSDEERENLYEVVNKIYEAKTTDLSFDSLRITSAIIELSDVGMISPSSARDITREFSEKIQTAGVLGIQDFLGATVRQNDLSDFEQLFENFSRMLTDDDYDPVMGTPASTSAPAATATTRFTTIEEGKVFRPNGEEYKPREINGHTDVALLRELCRQGIFVRLAGPPGGGKTALTEATFGKELITVTGHGDMTVANFVGTWIPRRHRAAGESEWEWVDGPLSYAMKQGKKLFVDEGTRIPREILNILYSVMDGRNILRLDDRPDMEPIYGKEGFYVIMGYNPDTLGAHALDEALVSRFRVQINVYTDFPTALALGVPSKAVKIAERMDALDKEMRTAGGPGVWVPQMRELLTFRDLVTAGVGTDFALSTLLASCPREVDVPYLVEVIHDVTKKTVTLPTLGGCV